MRKHLPGRNDCPLGMPLGMLLRGFNAAQWWPTNRTNPHESNSDRETEKSHSCAFVKFVGKLPSVDLIHRINGRRFEFRNTLQRDSVPQPGVVAHSHDTVRPIQSGQPIGPEPPWGSPLFHRMSQSRRSPPTWAAGQNPVGIQPVLIQL